ncbi:STAS domain-containing protein [Streptomyces diastaticus]|uniref:Predicted NTP binding protein (Contains STAS domain) n=1 Tax=Streptomyces griseus TaxID=1911 RepID=A0A380ML54_STRGR|nr:STAS domain-containing protein [Streptomyces griseus]SUO93375.1 Predicted NTP binding protein (contains STAS domain) [Streptomyces griseus]
MTPPDDLDDTGLTLTAEPDAPGTLGLRLAGSLDHESADALVRAVARHLETPPAPRLLRLECAGLTTCDALGLAALLMLGRRARAADCLLRLGNRPARLEKLLAVTGTHGYLVGQEPRQA